MSAAILKATEIAKRNPHIKTIHNDFWQLPIDHRVYFAVELTNGVKILVIQDDQAVRDLFLFGFHSGFGRDPAGLLGLAHFHEHTAPLDTADYSDGRDYKDYLFDELSLEANARTIFSWTIFHHDLIRGHISEAASILKSLCVCPKFPVASFETELRAIENEFVSHKIMHPALIALLTVAVNDEHYFKKTGVGHRGPARRVAERGAENVRAHLAVFNARVCVGPETVVAYVTSDPVETLLDSIVETFIDLPVRPATTLADMEGRIRCAGLNATEVQGALDEQLAVQYPPPPDVLPFNRSRNGSLMRVAAPDKPAMQISFAFPLDLQVMRQSNAATMLELFFKTFCNIALDLGVASALHHRLPVDTIGDRAYQFAFGDVFLPEGVADESIAFYLAKIMFKAFGTWLTLPEATLKEAWQNGTSFDSLSQRRWPLTMDGLIAMTTGPGPIEKAVFDRQYPSGREWNYTNVVDVLKDWASPRNLIIVMQHSDYWKRCHESPSDWKINEHWHYKYQYEPISEDRLREWETIYNDALSGRSTSTWPLEIPYEMGSYQWKEPTEDESDLPPMLEVPGHTEEDLKQLVHRAKHLGFPVDVDLFKAWPGYFEVEAVPGKKLAVFHELSPSTLFQFSQGTISLFFESNIGESSTSAELHIGLLLASIAQATGQVGTAAAGIEGTQPVCLTLRADGQADIQKARFLQLIDSVQKTLDGTFEVEDAFLRQVQTLREQLLFGLLTDVLQTDYHVPFNTLQRTRREEIEFVTRDDVWDYAHAVSLLRLYLATSVPKLVVVGNFLRREAYDLAVEISNRLDFRTVEQRHLPQFRSQILPARPWQLMTLGNNTTPGLDYSYFAYEFSIDVGDDEGCSKGVLFDFLEWQMNLASYACYRRKHGMCYSTRPIAFNYHRPMRRRFFGMLVESTTHGATQLFQQYEQFRNEFRIRLEELPDATIRRRLRTSAIKKLQVEPKEGYYTMRASSLQWNHFDRLRGLYCGLRAAEWLSDIAGFRVKLQEAADLYYAPEAPQSHDVVHLIERETASASLEFRYNGTVRPLPLGLYDHLVLRGRLKVSGAVVSPLQVKAGTGGG